MRFVGKTLSIIIPAYNVSPYIKRCLDSILFFSDNDGIEVIVIDGISPDSGDLKKILNTYAKLYPNKIKVAIPDKHIGQGQAILLGIEEASGDYIQIVGADDWANFDIFSYNINFLQSCKADAIIYNYQVNDIYSNSSIEYKCVDNSNSKLVNIHPTNIVMRRSLLADIDIKNIELYTNIKIIACALSSSQNIEFRNYYLFHHFLGRSDQETCDDFLFRNRKTRRDVILDTLDSSVHDSLTTIAKRYLQNEIFTQYNIYTKRKRLSIKQKLEIISFDAKLRMKYSYIELSSSRIRLCAKVIMKELIPYIKYFNILRTSR